MRPILAVFFMLVSFTLAGNLGAFESSAPRTLPSVHAVLPSSPLAFDAPAFDWQAHDLAAAAAGAPRTARTIRNVLSPVDVPKVWTCSAPRGLDTDATATVRVCEYR